MKKLTKLEKVGLIAAIVVCGSYFYMKRVYDPEAARLKRTIDKLNKTVAQYNQVQDTPSTKPLLRKISKKEGVLEELNITLRDEGGRTGEDFEVTEVMQKINSAAKEQEVRVNKILPEEDIEDNLFPWKVFQVELHGKYNKIVQLISALKEMKEPVQVRNMEIIKDVTENGVIIVTVTLLV